VSRLCRALVLAVVALGASAPSAPAVPNKKPGATLGVMWQQILETPTPENPYTGGDPCVDLGGVVAPFGPPGTTSVVCTVKPGTKIFVAAWSGECSTVEEDPYFGEDESELRTCARALNDMITKVVLTLDGRPVPVTRVESGLLTLDLPSDNILGAPAGRALSVADGFVALLHPLTPGIHTIALHIAGESPPGTPVDLDNTTTIIVQPGR
jgi:hypothetical protein